MSSIIFFVSKTVYQTIHVPSAMSHYHNMIIMTTYSHAVREWGKGVNKKLSFCRLPIPSRRNGVKTTELDDNVVHGVALYFHRT